MKRRIIAASIAILVAIVSSFLLLGYVSGADHRAMAGMQTATVLVVTTVVPKGTSAAGLQDLVAARKLPVKAIADGAISNLSQITGRVANTQLEPGEQVLATRFSNPTSLNTDHTIQVPKGQQELSVQLEPQRVAGGNLAAGDRVGVFISVGSSADKAQTHMALHQVLVTRVQAPPSSTSSSNTADAQKNGSNTIPTGSLIITIAVTARQAEQVVFAAEYGHLWMSLEDKDSSNTNTRIVTEGNVNG